MNGALAVYVVFCFAIFLMVLEAIGFHRWRWGIADLLKITFLTGVMLAIGRFLAAG